MICLWWPSGLVRMAWSVLAPLFLLCGQLRAGQRSFDFILWDGHRFARSAEEHERDFRWYRDLGFTHSFLGNANEDPPRDEGRAKIVLRLAEQYGLSVGLRFHFHREWKDLAQKLGLTKDEMIARGILLSKQAKKGHPPYSPMHPEVIR